MRKKIVRKKLLHQQKKNCWGKNLSEKILENTFCQGKILWGEGGIFVRKKFCLKKILSEKFREKKNFVRKKMV